MENKFAENPFLIQAVDITSKMILFSKKRKNCIWINYSIFCAVNDFWYGSGILLYVIYVLSI